MMTLDERIEKDLTELYNGGKLNGIISDANTLSTGLFGSLNELSACGMPGHFTGNRDADTVIVMLNPGKDVENANKQESTKEMLKKLNIDTKTLDSFITTYKKGNENFGNLSKGSAFDVKQARFLAPWEDSGISFPSEFPVNNNTYLGAKKAVLLQKLQLELVPYCSKTFEINTKNIKILIPYIETLFHEIFSKKRKYILFCGNVFEELFSVFNDVSSNSIVMRNYEEGPVITKTSKGTDVVSHCQIITINYNGEQHNALIANSFAHRRLTGNKMSNYGKFCYDTYINSKI